MKMKTTSIVLSLFFVSTFSSASNSREFVGQVMSGRLTLESGVGVSGSNQGAKSTLYFTPYNGTDVTLYIHNKWKFFSLSELSMNLSGLTSDKNYDVFIYSSNSGVIGMELSSAWADDTTRTNALALQDEVLVKSADHKRRYVGTIRTSSITTTEDTNTQRFVWNYYNRVSRTLTRQETSDSWSCGTSYQNVNNSASNRLELVVGADEVLASGSAVLYGSGTLDSLIVTGFGWDTNTTNSATFFGTGIGSGITASRAYITSTVNEGYHSVEWLEKCDSSVTAYGDNGGVGGIQSEITLSLPN